MNKRVMLQCRTEIKRDAVSRTTIDGIEHIIVKSSTLPDNVVMNGVLYSAEEIEKSFHGLEMTLAPIEHPNINGEFLSANDPRAIHNFHAGAFNTNVKRENGRVHIDKFINVQEALKTDRGKRLLDRIKDLENNSLSEPIHTSVGVFLSINELEETQTNANGDEFKLEAFDMAFDHDAILLDSVGAATPEDGVGIAVNNGQQFAVNQFEIKQSEKGKKMTPEELVIHDKKVAEDAVKAEMLKVNAAAKIEKEKQDAIKADEDKKAADALLKVNEDTRKLVASAVEEATKPLTDKITVMETEKQAVIDAELTKLAEIVVNSKKYPGMEVEDAKKLGKETLGKMAATCTPAFGVSPLVNQEKDDLFAAPIELVK